MCIATRIDDWVKRLRSSDKQPGGVARYVSNSPKFRAKVEKKMIQEVGDAMQRILLLAEQPRPGEAGCSPASTKANLHFCMPRFDAIINPMAIIWPNLKPMFEALTEEEIEGGTNSGWATELLDRNLAYEPLVSMGLALDIFATAKDWTHSRDQRKRGTFT